MSEKLPKQEKMEKLVREHETLALPTPEQAEKLRKGEKDPKEMLETARHEIAETAEDAKKPLEKMSDAAESNKPAPNLNVNQELKAITLRRELNHIRRKLPARQRALSKVIHQPAVRVVSEAAGKTVSRPSGLLGGGIAALIGTTLYMFIASQAGIAYNYTVFLLMFAGGFIIGLFVELGVYAATSGRRHAND